MTDSPSSISLSDENIWTPATDIGTYITGNFEPTNTYSAVQQILSGYAMGDFVISPNFRAIAGLRVETFTHNFLNQNTFANSKADRNSIIRRHFLMQFFVGVVQK